MELILVRHGTTRGNVEHFFVGRLDLPLLPEGEELARRVAPTLPAVEHIYRSPMLRCRQTAQLLWPGVETTVVEELRETDFGPYEGRREAELADDPLYRAWADRPGGPNFAASPLGETEEQVAVRVTEGLRKVSEDARRRGLDRAAVVTHGGTLMGLLTQYGRPERPYGAWFCPNCGGYRAELSAAPLALNILGPVGGEQALKNP